MTLGLYGSLRQNSLNRMCLQAIQTKQPDLVIWDRIGELPFFNPDIEHEENQVVTDYRNYLRAAKAVIIASPEYAHGVTGVMKNALDWVVGAGEFMQKPTIVLNCSHSSTIANLALRETLNVMEAQVIPFSFPLKSHGTTIEQILNDPILSSKLDEIARILTIPY
jgi:chromate reductase, NAD(P)H dehydrogenase (quinone)